MPEENTLTNLPLWELVKSTTYGRYLLCTSHYEAVMRDYLKGKAIAGIRKSKHESDFIASVLGVYIDLAPKINYPRKKEYEQLAELDGYMNPEGETLTYGEAVHYFGLLRRLIEDLGLTRTEYKETSDASRLVGGLTG
jgi:hypothetical protein